MDLPQVLIVSTKKEKAKRIAQNIGAKCLSQKDNFVDYLWNIDNKYYTSQILIRTVENMPCKLPMENVDALIIYHDPQTDNIDQELEYLASLTTALTTAEILLFSCSPISDALLRDKMLNWCLRNKFELVELKQAGELESDAEDNKFGIDRITEALQAHTWPNIILKDKHAGTKDALNEIGERFENIWLTQDPAEKLHMQHMLDGIMGEETADFGELFSHLTAMKKHAASLPTDARRIVAEQVVTTFWKAIGGDHLEIED